MKFKRNSKGVVALALVCGALIATIGIGVAWYFGVEKNSENKTTQSSSEDSTSENVVSENGINAKILKSDSSAKTTTIGYSVSPTDFTGEVKSKIEWASSSVTDAIGDYLTLSQDSTAKTVTVTCLKAFANQAKVTIYSADDPTISAVVTIDYNNRVDTYVYDKASGKTTISNTTSEVDIAYTTYVEKGSMEFGNTPKIVSVSWGTDFVSEFGNCVDSQPTTNYTMMTDAEAAISSISSITSSYGNAAEIALDTSKISAGFVRDLTVQDGMDDDIRTGTIRGLSSHDLSFIFNNPVFEVTFENAFTNAVSTGSTENYTADIYISPSYVTEPISSITAGKNGYVF